MKAVAAQKSAKDVSNTASRRNGSKAAEGAEESLKPESNRIVTSITKLSSIKNSAMSTEKTQMQTAEEGKSNV